MSSEKRKVNIPSPKTIIQSFITNKHDIPIPISNNVPCRSISGANLSDKLPATTEPMIPAIYIMKIIATKWCGKANKGDSNRKDR